MSGKFPDCLESFHIGWKVSRWSVAFPYCLVNFLTVCKLSRLSINLPDFLESFLITCICSRLSGKFSDCLESFQIVSTFHIALKISRLSGNFPDWLETFQISWKFNCFFFSVNFLQALLPTCSDNHFLPPGMRPNMTCKLSRFSGKFLIVYKVSRLSVNFPDCVKTFKIFWKVIRLSHFFFRLSGNFQGCLKTFQVVWKVSTLSVSFT